MCQLTVCCAVQNVSGGQTRSFYGMHVIDANLVLHRHCTCTCCCCRTGVAWCGVGDKVRLVGFFQCMDWRWMPGNVLSQPNTHDSKTAAHLPMWHCVKNIIGWERHALVQTARSRKGQRLVVNKCVFIEYKLRSATNWAYFLKIA